MDLNRKIFELRAGQAKTASRRVVPISENLAAWLSPLNRQSPVVAGARGHNDGSVSVEFDDSLVAGAFCGR